MPFTDFTWALNKQVNSIRINRSIYLQAVCPMLCICTRSCSIDRLHGRWKSLRWRRLQLQKFIDLTNDRLLKKPFDPICQFYLIDICFAIHRTLLFSGKKNMKKLLRWKWPAAVKCAIYFWFEQKQINGKRLCKHEIGNEKTTEFYLKADLRRFKCRRIEK